MFAFLIGELSGDKQRASRYDAVLRRASLEEMWQPQRIAGDYTQGWMRPQTAVGLGFFIDDIDGRRYVGHNGDQNGFRAFVSICPQTGAASLLALNSETRPSTNDPANLRSAESRIALSVLPCCRACPNDPEPFSLLAPVCWASPWPPARHTPRPLHLARRSSWCVTPKKPPMIRATRH